MLRELCRRLGPIRPLAVCARCARVMIILSRLCENVPHQRSSVRWFVTKAQRRCTSRAFAGEKMA